MSNVSFEDRIISNGFSFSSNSDVISVSKSVQSLKEEEQEVFIKLAEKTRSIYMEALDKVKEQSTGKANYLTIRRESIAKAKAELVIDLGEVKVQSALEAFSKANEVFVREKKSQAKLVASSLKKSKVISKVTKLDTVEEKEPASDPYEL